MRLFSFTPFHLTLLCCSIVGFAGTSQPTKTEDALNLIITSNTGLAEFYDGKVTFKCHIVELQSKGHSGYLHEINNNRNILSHAEHLNIILKEENSQQVALPTHMNMNLIKYLKEGPPNSFF